jgi:hypothetical protein
MFVYFLRHSPIVSWLLVLFSSLFVLFYPFRHFGECSRTVKGEKFGIGQARVLVPGEFVNVHHFLRMDRTKQREER